MAGFFFSLQLFHDSLVFRFFVSLSVNMIGVGQPSLVTVGEEEEVMGCWVGSAKTSSGEGRCVPRFFFFSTLKSFPR